MKVKLVKLVFDISKPNNDMIQTGGNIGYEQQYYRMIDVDLPVDIVEDFAKGNIRNIGILKVVQDEN